MDKVDPGEVALRIVVGMLDVLSKRDPTFAVAVADAVRPYMDARTEDADKRDIQAALNIIGGAG